GGPPGDVLFDRRFEEVVAIDLPDDAASTVTVTVAGADADTVVAALEHGFRRAPEALRGRSVRVRFTERAPEPAEAAAVLGLADEQGIERLEVEHGDRRTLWLPRLFRVVARGTDTTLTVVPSGRDRVAVAEAFVRELDALARELSGRRVTVA